MIKAWIIVGILIIALPFIIIYGRKYIAKLNIDANGGHNKGAAPAPEPAPEILNTRAVKDKALTDAEGDAQVLALGEINKLLGN